MAIQPWQPKWPPEAVEVKEVELLHTGFYQLKRLHLRHKCFDGQWSPWLKREQVCGRDAAAVLLVDPQLEKVVLVEQCRTGIVGRKEANPWLLEVVAGLVEPGEDLQLTAKREAMEEAGCEIQSLIKIGEFYTTPGGKSEKTTLFCGTVDSAGVGGVHGLGAEHEDILVHVLSITEVLAAYEKGQLLTSSSTVIGLQWLALKWRAGHFMNEFKQYHQGC